MASLRMAPLSDTWVRRLNAAQVALVAFVILVPIAWMVVASFKPSAQVTASRARPLPLDAHPLRRAYYTTSSPLGRGSSPLRDGGAGRGMGTGAQETK